MMFLAVTVVLLNALSIQGSNDVCNGTDFSGIARKIRAVDWRIAGGHWTTGANQGGSTYSTIKSAFDALVSSGDVNKTVELGFVAKGSRELSLVCPLLFMLTIYQETAGNQRTFIAVNSVPTPTTKGVWVTERAFLCSPYEGYCGADTLLWGLQNWQPYHNIMHTVELNEVVENSVGDNYPYRLCYIWSI